MRLLIIGPLSASKYSTLNRGGVATVMSTLIDSFVEQKINFDLIGTGNTNRTRHDTSLKNKFSVNRYIKLFMISWSYLLALEFKSFLLFNYYSFFFNKIAFDKYDVIQVHGLQGRIIDVIAYLSSKPIVLTVHSYHEFMNKRKFKLNFCIKAINRTLSNVVEIIHVSETDKLKGIELGFNIPELSKVIYNPIAIDQPSKNELNRDFNRIIFAGSLNKRKQIGVLIESLNYLPEDIKLTVCGDGELKKEIEHSEKKSNKIEYQGFIKNDLLLKQYELHSVLVVPSLSESFGLVYLEAVTAGLSIIGYHKIINEFHYFLKLDEFEKRILVPFKGSDPMELSYLISETVKFRNSDKAEEAISSLKNKISQNFSINIITNKYLEIYKQIK